MVDLVILIFPLSEALTKALIFSKNLILIKI